MIYLLRFIASSFLQSFYTIKYNPVRVLPFKMSVMHILFNISTKCKNHLLNILQKKLNLTDSLQKVKGGTCVPHTYLHFERQCFQLFLFSLSRALFLLLVKSQRCIFCCCFLFHLF